MTTDGSASDGVRGTDTALLEIHARTYDHVDVTRLVVEVQAEYVRRYGGPDDSPVSPAEFDPPAGVFVVAYLAGDPVGTGAFRKRGDGVAEVKRMYVRPGARRRGVAASVLDDLEARAAAAGYARLVLETGEAQPEAMAFYTGRGFTEIEPYGFYRCSPLSHCYAKDLDLT